jgi:hypothetical protein
MIDKRWYSRILDVRCFRGAECDTDHDLVVSKVRERFSSNKQAGQNIDLERFYAQEAKVCQ